MVSDDPPSPGERRVVAFSRSCSVFSTRPSRDQPGRLVEAPEVRDARHQPERRAEVGQEADLRDGTTPSSGKNIASQ